MPDLLSGPFVEKQSPIDVSEVRALCSRLESLVATIQVIDSSKLQSGEEVRLILREMMSKVWTEAFYDAYDEKSYAIAHMLWPSMQRLNEIMKFK